MNGARGNISSQDPRLRALIESLSCAGVRTDGIGLLCRDENDRCIVAARSIRAEREVLRIPLRCIITPQVAIDSEIGREIAAAPLEVRSDQAWLALLILADSADQRSPWRAYIEALPAAVPEHPLFYGPRELKLLKGSTLRETIQEMRRVLGREHALLRRHVRRFRNLALARYQWA